MSKVRRIGIVGRTWPDRTFGVQNMYMLFAERYGLPMVIPNWPAAETERFIHENLDLVILPGGADVNPSRYGGGIVGRHSYPHYRTGHSNPFFEYFDDMVLPGILGYVPVFGICRGFQALLTHYCVPLMQHIPEKQHLYSASRDHLVHPVFRAAAVEQGASNLEPAFHVNSLHHQGIALEDFNTWPDETFARDVAKCLLVSSDDYVEAVIAKNKMWAGVQWHPEEMLEYTGPQRLATFFVDELILTLLKKGEEVNG